MISMPKFSLGLQGTCVYNIQFEINQKQHFKTFCKIESEQCIVDLVFEVHTPFSDWGMCEMG